MGCSQSLAVVAPDCIEASNLPIKPQPLKQDVLQVWIRLAHGILPSITNRLIYEISFSGRLKSNVALNLKFPDHSLI